MFTGIIEDVGTVKHIEKKGPFGRITVETALPLNELREGDSISVDGACLTAAGFSGNAFSADVSEETLRVTTLGGLIAGSKVNIERALTLTRPLGGHLVTGHIDGVGSIKKMARSGDYLDLEIAVPPELMAQVVKKGSISIDGISLTIADLGPGCVRIAIIPHTLVKTTLLSKREGSRVNIETDIIGKYVEKFFNKKESRITEEFLSEHGFGTKV
ncbi:MAG: riboflavin synthase [Deltaproteobacteria bacterium]|nr:riboflavin synthase [Deltaproteobacteria bacterium]MBZ0220578.1 riboflavin synthase [Deltaproteobacteria bacterium]